MIRFSRAVALCAVLLALPACSSIFTDEDGAPLTGERLPALGARGEEGADPALAAVAVDLPEPWTNQFWPQAGGYPAHAMGHLALGANLKEVWSASIGKAGARTPLSAQPVVADGVVFTLDAQGTVKAFDAASGTEKWSAKTRPCAGDETSAPGGGLSHGGGRVFVSNGCAFVAALDPATGAVAWRATLPAPAQSAPTVVDDRLYVVTMNNQMHALAVADGAALWSYTGTPEETGVLGAAAVAADKTLAVLPLSSGELIGLRPENGQVAWSDSLSSVRGAGPLSSIADIRGLPVIDQGAVYAASYAGRLVALDAVSGRRLWQREGGSAETPWPSGSFLFSLASDQRLLALSRDTGALKWSVQLPRFAGKKAKGKALIWSGPVVAGGRLILASSDGRMIEADPQTGKTLRETKLKGAVSLAPVVALNTLFVLSDSGRLTAYR